MRKLLTATALTLLLASCHHEAADHGETSTPSRAATPAATSSATPAAAPAASGPVTVRRADGAELLTLSENDNGIVEIQFAAADGAKRVLRGEPRDTGKRKYRVGDSAVMFEVKPGDDDGFKLRTADGKLRWKVKISIDKVKISDNEQNANPFELKLKESDRSKVVAPGDRELGKVRYDATVSKIEDATGKPLFDASKKSAAFGVLLIDGIPELERYILIAELLSRGK